MEFLALIFLVALIYKILHWQIHGKEVYNKLPKKQQSPLRRGSWFWFWIWAVLMLIVLGSAL